jgi:hypothetical protein
VRTFTEDQEEDPSAIGRVFFNRAACVRVFGSDRPGFCCFRSSICECFVFFILFLNRFSSSFILLLSSLLVIGLYIFFKYWNFMRLKDRIRDLKFVIEM